MARQSSILSILTEGFVSSSLLSVFSSRSFLSWNWPLPRHHCVRTKEMHSASDISWRIYHGAWLGNHPFYLCQLKDSWAQVWACSFLWFYWWCAQNQKIELQLPVEREFLPENSVKYLYQHNELVYLKKYSPSILYRALWICTATNCLHHHFQCGQEILI